MDVKKAAAETKDYIVSIRREFHRHPELSLQEFRTAQRIEEELDKFGIPHTRVGETGVLGTLKGAKDNGKVLVLRADIDALPIEETHECAYRSENAGVMHACGHDAHAACLLGAAKILSENRDAFGGKVRLVFQPGEEIGKGAKPFVAAGVLEGAERVFGLHTAYDLEAGTVGLKPGINNAAVDHFRIRVHGRSTHVSTPHMGVDALYIASQIVVAVQGLVTRRTSPTEPVIIGIGKLNAGTTYNAVAAFGRRAATASAHRSVRPRRTLRRCTAARRKSSGRTLPLRSSMTRRCARKLLRSWTSCSEKDTLSLTVSCRSAATILPSLSCISRARMRISAPAIRIFRTR